MKDEEIAQSWVNYYLTGKENKFWATEELLNFTFDKPNRAWNIVILINNIKIDDPNWQKFIDGCLAAGPIEELMSNHGDNIIGIVEIEARKNERLKKQLGMIYQSKISKETWERIKSL